MSVTFPGESAEYRAARDRLLGQEIGLRRAMEEVAAARRDLPPGGLVPEDHVFQGAGADGAPTDVRLSELFAPGKDSLVIYSFMFPRDPGDDRPGPGGGRSALLPMVESPCPSCTAMLDQLDGAAEHVSQRVNLVAAAKSPLPRLLAFAEDRGWRRLRLVSSVGNTYNRDYHGETAEGRWREQPGCSPSWAGGPEAMSGSRWALLGSPLDCSATGRGEERGPSALRSAGLVSRLRIEDRGDVHTPLTDTRRDPATGIVAFAQLRRACEHVRDQVSDVLGDGLRPLVVGGDCSFLVGALAGARLQRGRVGLVFFDGHLDCLDGDTSPTGECADMDLAISYGHGPVGLVDLAGPPPTVSPDDVIAVGHRSGDGLEERVVDQRVVRTGADELRRRGAAAVGEDVAARAGGIGRYWVHLDVDILDETALPAVTYPQGGGPDWEELPVLLRPVLAGAGLIGMSVADLVPPLDPGGVYADRLTALLADLLSP